MKKRTWLITIVVSLLLLIIGIGVKFHMDRINKQEEIRNAEETIAKTIISEYKGVKEIKFIKNTTLGESGYTQTLILINNTKSFGYDSAFDNPKDGEFADSDDYFVNSPLDDNNKRKEKLELNKINLSNYKIIYHLKIDE